VEFTDTDAQEKEANGQFGADHGNGVEQVTEVPGVFCILDTLDGKVMVVAACSMADAYAGGRGIGYEEELSAM